MMDNNKKNISQSFVCVCVRIAHFMGAICQCLRVLFAHPAKRGMIVATAAAAACEHTGTKKSIAPVQ